MNNQIKNRIKSLPFFFILGLIKSWFDMIDLRFIIYPFKFTSFCRDFYAYNRKAGDNKATMEHLYPCLFDKTSETPIDPVYFYQDCWAASKIFSLKPEKHVDIGSSLKTVGIISQFTPTEMVDIRTIPVSLKNLTFIEGSILNLPYEDESIESLSSLCVIEHIGLGRYGDSIDPDGSVKAIAELTRVLKPEGSLLFSVPVDSKETIYFNAHRAFTREWVINVFKDLELVEEKYQYGYDLCDHYEESKGFGTGLFHFQKNRRIKG
jgi:predicted SAM-dependent methyltransferase